MFILKTRFSQLIVAALCLMWMLQGAVAAQTDRWRAVTMLAESIRAPSSLSTSEREDKAYQLANLIQRKAGRAAPQKLITDLAMLMSDTDQIVRLWAAAALGNLGLQAAAAIPALEKAFGEAQIADPPSRARSGIHLDDVILQALEKIRPRTK